MGRLLIIVIALVGIALFIRGRMPEPGVEDDKKPAS